MSDGTRVYTVCVACGLLDGRHRATCEFSGNPGCASTFCNRRARSKVGILCEACLKRMKAKELRGDDRLAQLDRTWMARAACHGVADPDIFFPERGWGNANEKAPAAKALCDACPVSDACLDYALQLPGDEFGIFAGTNVKERRRLRQERAARAAVA